MRFALEAPLAARAVCVDSGFWITTYVTVRTTHVPPCLLCFVCFTTSSHQKLVAPHCVFCHMSTMCATSENKPSHHSSSCSVFRAWIWQDRCIMWIPLLSQTVFIQNVGDRTAPPPAASHMQRVYCCSVVLCFVLFFSHHFYFPAQLTIHSFVCVFNYVR